MRWHALLLSAAVARRAMAGESIVLTRDCRLWLRSAGANASTSCVCVCVCLCQHRPILLIFRISIARRPSVPELGILYTGSCIIKIHRTHFAIDGVNARRMHCRVSMYVCVCVRRWRTRLGIVGKIQPTHQTNTQANITCLPYITCGANTVCVRWYDYT